MASAVLGFAAPAQAATSIDIGAVGPANIAVDYSCEPSSGVVAIRAMVGDPNADAPSADGTQTAVTCDGGTHNAIVGLVGTPVAAGQTVQVRVALVDRDEIVVTGQAKLLSLA
ncbi:hypothetical protein D5S18_27265 [Nocardia panacis]|uniref:Uncharacterized protein n=1 Tax=Nocardia panacis TaxID=2340916 RepID=A0A3A4KDE0_9NOCA|nr:hypothetical protein D5S18_27265 [Nocardia panacis]